MLLFGILFGSTTVSFSILGYLVLYMIFSDMSYQRKRQLLVPFPLLCNDLYLLASQLQVSLCFMGRHSLLLFVQSLSHHHTHLITLMVITLEGAGAFTKGTLNTLLLVPQWILRTHLSSEKNRQIATPEGINIVI